mmetsp:Transcript_3054/g.10154  ORF Transcript_3054/g.10154 Transcript_3054/m.10154 type:complete len:209 (-) Transcript_3054:1149-1775(-)
MISVARLEMASQSPALMAFWSNAGATKPSELAPARKKSAAVSISTPEVGLMRNMGSAAATARTQFGPPATPGKSFCTGAPRVYALYNSLGVVQPGMHTILFSAHQVTTSGIKIGDTINLEPASMAALASSMLRIVPHPVKTSVRDAKRDTASRQPGVVSVNSARRKPPCTAASMALYAAPSTPVRSTAHALCLANCSSTWLNSASVRM